LIVNTICSPQAAASKRPSGENLSEKQPVGPTLCRKQTYIHAYIYTCCVCLQDPNGNLVKEEELRGWPSSVLKHCGEVARKLSDLDKEDEAEKEKAVKNG